MTSFRLATISDYWRAANKRQFPIQIEKIVFNDCPLLNNLEISFGRGIHAISGANGIGKSSLIKLMFNCLIDTNENIGGREKFIISHTSPENVELKVVSDGNEHVLRSDDVEKFDTAIFDPCSIMPTLQRFYQELTDLDEVVSANGTYAYNGSRLETLNYLSNHEYQSVLCCDIDESFSGSPLTTMPFFRVINRHGQEYDSRTMGLGEFSLFYFEWLVFRIKSSECKIFILEEPESYLPPSIQKRLSDVLAYLAKCHSVQSIICTHSDAILYRIDRKNITTLRRISGQLKAFNANSNFESLKLLGLNARKKGVIFCEDEAAEAFSKKLVSICNSHVVDNFYYHRSGSNGDIENILKSLPSKVDSFIFYGLFDGDCRQRNQDAFRDKKYSYLPSEMSPENLLLPHFRSLDLSNKSALFSKNEDSIALALDYVDGLEAHDYFNEFFSHLNISKASGFEIIIDSYLLANSESRIVKQCLDVLDSIA
ncbi:hypothetical protein SN10_19065 [Vibrio harveyi]|nr:hypothetical protein SN10_19065 [Vibrio harveyi]